MLIKNFKFYLINMTYYVYSYYYYFLLLDINVWNRLKKQKSILLKNGFKNYECTCTYYYVTLCVILIYYII